MGKIEEGRGGKTGFLGSEGSNDGMKSKSRNGCGIGDGTGIFLGVSIGENWGILSAGFSQSHQCDCYIEPDLYAANHTYRQ